MIPLKRFILANMMTRRRQPTDQYLQINDDKRGVRLACRSKRGCNATVNLQVVTLEPTATARRKIGRLGNLRNLKNAAVESPRARRLRPALLAERVQVEQCASIDMLACRAGCVIARL